MSQKTVLYAGSFDPFTLGHLDVARKAAALFDHLVVMIGVNVRKRRSYPAEEMADAIRRALSEEGIHNAEVVLWDGLLTDYCRERDIHWYARGLRTSTDYAYEEDAAQINRLLLPELETIYLRSDRPALSASVVRELMSFGHDASPFVPPAVWKLISK